MQLDPGRQQAAEAMRSNCKNGSSQAGDGDQMLPIKGRIHQFRDESLDEELPGAGDACDAAHRCR